MSESNGEHISGTVVNVDFPNEPPEWVHFLLGALGSMDERLSLIEQQNQLTLPLLNKIDDLTKQIGEAIEGAAKHPMLGMLFKNKK